MRRVILFCQKNARAETVHVVSPAKCQAFIASRVARSATLFMPFYACLVTQVEGHLAVGRGLTTALCAEPVIDVPWLRDPSLALNHERVRTNECAASLISLHYRFFIILIVNLFLLLS